MKNCDEATVKSCEVRARGSSETEKQQDEQKMLLLELGTFRIFDGGVVE
jgi:hypothetical protein